MSNEQTVQSTERKETEISYNQTLGFWDLFFIAVGTIIGSGIMVMTGRAIAMTGRSVAFAYVGSAIWVICLGIPTVLMTSCIRLLGGAYTQFNLFVGEKYGGFYLAISLLSQMGHNLYAQTFALYFCELFNLSTSWEKPVAAGCICLFYFINFFGVDAMAKAQNFMSSLLLVVLFWFTVRGFPKIQPGFFGEGFMTDGFKGLFAASTLLTYALLGGTQVMPYSADAKNPKRDLPLAAVSSTLIIAVLFSLMGAVCAGVLPVEQVAGQSLSMVAKHILTYPEYVVFMVGGALFAAATTLNGVLGSVAKPAVMMSYDGWLPKSMAVLHPKYNTPWKWQIFYFIMTMLPLILGFDIKKVTDLTLLGSYTMSALQIWGLRKLPQMFPEQWSKSMFRLPDGVFKVVMTICFLAALSNVWGMLSSSTMQNIAINVGVMAVGLGFSFIRWGSGKVTPSKSWSDS